MADHYFAAEPGSVERRQQVTASVWGVDLQLESATGVFSAGRVDLGTGVLFRATDPPAGPGSYLDLGCGYGVIACALAAVNPDAEVWAVDVNDRALELCRDNAAATGASDRVHAVHPEEVPDDVGFTEIWSNPPIRVGKAALHELLLRWLPRLTTSGRAMLVVGKNLGADSLQRWLVEQGFSCRRVASAKGFRVLEVKRTAEAVPADARPDPRA